MPVQPGSITLLGAAVEHEDLIVGVDIDLSILLEWGGWKPAQATRACPPSPVPLFEPETISVRV